MVIWAIMRILPGIWARTSDTARFEKAVTAITEMHITILTLMLPVTASAEHIPRICNAIGLLLKIGSRRTFLADNSAIIKPPLHAVFPGTEQSHAYLASSPPDSQRRDWSVLPRTGHQPYAPGLLCRRLLRLLPA